MANSKDQYLAPHKEFSTGDRRSPVRDARTSRWRASYPRVQQELQTQPRLLAKLLRDLVSHESFETLSDLADALKCRCARLRIRWTGDDISQAFALVESNRALVAAPPRVFDVAHPPNEVNLTLSHANSLAALRRMGWPE
jgi:hypothetical protein